MSYELTRSSTLKTLSCQVLWKIRVQRNTQETIEEHGYNFVVHAHLLFTSKGNLAHVRQEKCLLPRKISSLSPFVLEYQ